MPKVYVLNVPEFEGLISSARAQGNCTIRTADAYYTSIEAKGELVFNRKAAGFIPAVWYAALTGGVDGEIVEFGRDVLRIVDSSPD